MINFSEYQFHPVVFLPQDYEIYDFTKGYDENRHLKNTDLKTPYGVGRYNEKRKNMYTEEQYQTLEGTRDIHMGIDISGPVGTPVHAFYEGEIYAFAYNALKLDYGNTLITKHHLDGHDLYCLLGHLNKKSIENKKVSQKVTSGEVLGWFGDRSENGGWNPHVHIQLSYEKPLGCDMPGAVSRAQLEHALKIYPDPRYILGPIY